MPNILNKLGYTITHLTEEVKDIATKVAGYTKEVEAILNGSSAKTIAEIVPDGEQDREKIIAILETALKACQAIQSFDTSGVSARLQRAGSDLTQLIHADSKHTISFYITCFEVVFNDLFGS